MENVPDTCFCREALQRPYTAVENALIGVNSDKILVNSDQIARSDEKWMFLYRCRICGTHWIEACYSSGHMDLYYLFPVPPTDDLIRWMHEEAAELPRYA